MKNKLIYIALTIILLPLFFCIVQPAYGQFPEMPHRFYGNVTVEGTAANQDTTVAAYLNNEEISSTTTDTDGKYGYSPVFTVTAQNGDILEFFIAGEKALETYTFSSGSITNLNLTVGAGASQSEPPANQQAAPPPPPDYSTSTQSQTENGQDSQSQSEPDDTTTTPPAENSAAPENIASTAFNLTGLKVSPESVKPGKQVTITAQVANNSDDAGTYTVTLMVNNTRQAEKEVTLEPWQVEKVTFQISRDDPGLYTINVNGMESTFSVAGETATQVKLWPIIGLAVCALLIILLAVILLRRRLAY